MIGQKIDFVVSVAKEFDLHAVGYVGDDMRVAEAIHAALEEDGVTGPVDGCVDLMFLDRCWGDDPRAAIAAGWQTVRPGGFLMGTDYTHDEVGLPVQHALEDGFNLMSLQIGPAAVWAVRKGEG